MEDWIIIPLADIDVRLLTCARAFANVHEVDFVANGLVDIVRYADSSSWVSSCCVKPHILPLD